LQRAISFLKQMAHRLVSEFFQDIGTPKKVFLVMEFAKNANLLDSVNSDYRLPLITFSLSNKFINVNPILST
jgi:hypothetical protein